MFATFEKQIHSIKNEHVTTTKKRISTHVSLPAPNQIKMACIALDEILPGSKVTVYPGQRVDAVELTMVSTGHDRHDSLQTLRRLSTENFEKKKLFLLKLPGKGNQKTYTIHFRDALELIMVFPGKFATETRKKEDCIFAAVVVLAELQG